jgi:hypothetical protein
MEQVRCSRCGYMNHPDMEMCAKCGQSLKGFFSNLNISTTSEQVGGFDINTEEFEDTTKERLYDLLNNEKFAKNLTPELKNKIETAIQQGKFKVTTSIKTHGNTNAEGLESARQLREHSREGQEIKSSARAVIIFVTAIAGLIIVMAIVVFIVMMQSGSTP